MTDIDGLFGRMQGRHQRLVRKIMDQPNYDFGAMELLDYLGIEWRNGEDLSEGKMQMEVKRHPANTYPSAHPPGSFWATTIGWDILDRLPVGTLDPVQRAFLCGLIGGALVKVMGFVEGPIPKQ